MKDQAQDSVVEAVQEQATQCAVNSFTAGTLVLMADGSRKPIEQVKTGDKVIATDPETGRTRAKPVTGTIIGEGAKNLVAVTIDVDGAAGSRTATVEATDGHPFWVPELGEWIDATDLREGQKLHSDTGARLTIERLHRWTEDARVFNLTVQDIHTYYVMAGPAPVLVHNCGNASTHDPDNIFGNLDDDVYFHYSDERGYNGILDEDGGLRFVAARGSGKVHVTQEIGSQADIERNIYIGSTTHSGKAGFLFVFRMPQGAELGYGSQPNERIHRGSLKIPRGT
ncbi:polymorphic toxin-type HINT domain-containing protein [Streptomyces sp. NPDC097619]|uniref:polymorphic toxin-type HINT domain-containing protein n=1 Tax=Streptomyces sp. NPDC097619 TaxID=3157228 RepID=UPI00331F6FC2